MSPMLQDVAIVAVVLVAAGVAFWIFAPRRDRAKSSRTVPEWIVYGLHLIARWFVCLADAADYGLQAFRKRKLESGIVLECSGWGMRESQKEAA